jgi:allantoicase
VNLADERLGARVLSASDEFFASKENLIKHSPAIFIPDKYTDRGKWMDGWESRRRRGPGHDSCVVKLCGPGLARGIIVDTSHFTGNYPESCSIEGCEDLEKADWFEIVPRAPLRGNGENLFSAASQKRCSAVRLNIFPDGGVARLRVFGEIAPRKFSLASDLAAITNGASAVCCSDEFFGCMESPLLPGFATDMSDGWETRRRRGLGNDWLVVRLACPARIHRIELDTDHFKGNFPQSASVESASLNRKVLADEVRQITWRPLLLQTPLKADFRHVFEISPRDRSLADHLRLQIYPDGGIARFRVFGESDAWV